MFSDKNVTKNGNIVCFRVYYCIEGKFKHETVIKTLAEYANSQVDLYLDEDKAIKYAEYLNKRMNRYEN